MMATQQKFSLFTIDLTSIAVNSINFIKAKLLLWFRNHETRLQLKDLDQIHYNDIGRTTKEVAREANKNFWQ